MSTFRMMKSFLRIAAGLILVFTLSVPQSAAHASTYTVINTNDSGVGSLRQAILDANAHAGDDTIAFAIPDTDPGFELRTENVWTIVLTTGELFLTGSGTTINGSTQGEYNAFGPEIEVTQSSAASKWNIASTGISRRERPCQRGTAR